MIWSKTDAGRTEMQTRLLIKERAQRNLLLLIDGVKSEATLMASISGVTTADFKLLADLGLVAPIRAPAARSSPARRASPDPQSYTNFTATLTQLIAEELGLRGFSLTLAVEKASTPSELRDVAERVLKQIFERKGPAAAERARSALYGE